VCSVTQCRTEPARPLPYQDGQCTYNVTFGRVCVSTAAVAKQQALYNLSVCVSVAVAIQHAKRMRRIISSPATWSALPYASTLSHKRHDFRKKNTEHKMCFDFLYSFSLKCFLF
jgi:hypothetical protein